MLQTCPARQSASLPQQSWLGRQQPGFGLVALAAQHFVNGAGQTP
jgi:hypothetical protein